MTREQLEFIGRPQRTTPTGVSILNSNGGAVAVSGPVSVPSGGSVGTSAPSGYVIPGLTHTVQIMACEGTPCVTSDHDFVIDPLLDAGARAWMQYDTKKVTDRLSLSSNEGSGDGVLTLQLMSVPGIAGDKPLTLTYNSLMAANAASYLGDTRVGHGWTLSTGQSVFLTQDSLNNVYVHYGDGLVAPFIYKTSTSYYTPAGVNSTLMPNTPATGQWTLTAHTGSGSLIFDTSADADGQHKLLEQKDRSGNYDALSYNNCTGDGRPVLNSITGTRGDASGKVVRLGYDNYCHLNEISQSASDGSTREIYPVVGSTSDLLTDVTDGVGGVYHFGYTSGLLTSITHSSGASRRPPQRRLPSTFTTAARVLSRSIASMRRRFLVTGATGSIGNAVLREQELHRHESRP